MVDLLNRVLGAVGVNGGVVLRYLVTSGINVITHQLLLQIAVQWWGWGGGVANVFAAMITVIPAYLLSRYWVWQVDGAPSLRREIIPFWLIAAAGLILSTFLAEVADRRFEWPLLISAASLAGYFVVWVTKFLILNRMFKRPSPTDEMVEA